MTNSLVSDAAKLGDFPSFHSSAFRSEMMLLQPVSDTALVPQLWDAE